ncbi:MAG TPA: MBL fold metallo-hydrolase [Mycobacteriales bacterium]|nr:MBL fold metallo-hydrolase [Mycobacteriales bacterium]
MRLTVLGCSGTYPGPDSPCSGYLVEQDGFRLVVDLGNGALGQLQRHCDLRDVDAVWISHLHADHCLDLVAYSYARRYHRDGPPPLLAVHGPAGLAERIRGSFESPPLDGLDDVYDYTVVGAGTTVLGPFEVTAARVEHPVEAHALRLRAGGSSLVYSGDTGRSDALVELARDCDLLLCEASWESEPPPPPGIHLTGRDAGEHAARAGVGRLVLTHLVPFVDPQVILAEAREAYAGPLALARCGDVFEF